MLKFFRQFPTKRNVLFNTFQCDILLFNYLYLYIIYILIKINFNSHISYNRYIIYISIRINLKFSKLDVSCAASRQIAPLESVYYLTLNPYTEIDKEREGCS